MNNNVKQAMKLKKVVVEKINTNEYNLVKVSGVSLSRSDLDSLEMYSDQLIQTNGLNFGNFMTPRGNIKKVLDSYGIIVKERFGFWA